MTRAPDVPHEAMAHFRLARKTAIAKGHAIPLLARHDVYLTVTGGNGPRFASAFKATWKRAPLWARRRLLAHWRTGPQTYGYFLSPTIELCNYQFGGRRAMGMVDHCGHRFRFRSKCVDKMPEEVVQDLIAHELAHGIQFAQGIRCVREFSDGRAEYVCADGSLFGGNFELEYGADEMIDWWGFDSESVDRWSLAAGIAAGIAKAVNVADPVKGLEMVIRRMDRSGR